MEMKILMINYKIYYSIKTNTNKYFWRNNNYKKIISENDTRLISQFYKEMDISIDVQLRIEYLRSIRLICISSL